MDPRVSLGLISAAGAFLGAGVMLATAPDTGTVPTFAPTVAAPIEVPEALPEAPIAQPGTPQALSNEVLGLPVADDGWGTIGDADNPFAAPPAGGDPFAAAAPPPPRINPLHPQQRGAIVPEGGPYPADVRGVGQMFRDRQPKVDECMTRQGPAANPGEMAVMLRMNLMTDPADGAKGRVQKIEAMQDDSGRYQYFIQCLQGVMDDAALMAPPSGNAIVHWSVRR